MSDINSATSLAPAPRSYKWWLAIILTLLAAVIYSAPLLLTGGLIFGGMGTRSTVERSGLGGIGIFLFLSLLYLLFARLIFQWVPLCPFDRWRYAVVVTILAILIFSPFLQIIFRNLTMDAGYWLYLAQVIIYFFLVRLVFI